MAPLSLLIALAAAALAVTGATAAVTPQPDTPFEQIISDRYLFSGNAAECTSWPELSILSAWSAVAAPLTGSFPQGQEGAWMLAEVYPSQYAMISFNVQTAQIIQIDDIAVQSTEDLLYSFPPSSISVSSNVQAVLVSPKSITLISLYAQAMAHIDIEPAYAGTPRSAVFVPTIGQNGVVYIGTDSGLHVIDVYTQAITYQLNNITEPISALAYGYTATNQVVFIGSATHLRIHTLANAEASIAERWRAEEVTALIDSAITSLVYDQSQNRLWIGYFEGATWFSPVLMADGETHWAFSRLAGIVSDPGGYVAGLPFADISVLAAVDPAGGASDGRVWLGTPRAVMRFDADAENAADRWRVFNSARYLPQRDALVNVSSVAVLPFSNPPVPNQAGNTVVAITNKGLAVLRSQKWTLQQKALWFQTYLEQPERHSKYGLVADCNTPVFGNTAQCVKFSNDNDGLWTAIYLSGQIWRYMTNTSDASVHDAAWSHFEAMMFQSEATNITGYPGRSIALSSDPQSNPSQWHPAPNFPGWSFKGDTSSDEITGHQQVYPLVYSLLADQTNATQLSMVLSLLTNITDNIIEHGWYLFGEYGNHTRWGVWAPELINNDPNWQEGRGPNSIQILSWLAQAFVLTGEQQYLTGLQTLMMEPVRYDANLLNQKMIALCDSDFSDDEMSYQSFFTLHSAFNRWSTHSRSSSLFSSKQIAQMDVIVATLESYMQAGLDLGHRYKVMEKSPFYNALYCYASGQVGANEERTRSFRDADDTESGADESSTSPAFDCTALMSDAVWYLRRWPLELLDWPQFNSDRLDVQINVPAECPTTERSERAARSVQAGSSGLNSLTLLPPDERIQAKWNTGPFSLDGGSGFNEEGPGAVLFGYWMGRAYGMIGAPAEQN